MLHIFPETPESVQPLVIGKSMNATDATFLALPRFPARLDAQQTALILGFHDHDIPILIQARLLKPLGEAPPNSPKYFAACDVETVARDPQWLNKATKALTTYWRKKKSGATGKR